MADRAKAMGCYGMWVLTDNDNDAAKAAYAAAGGANPSNQVMLDSIPEEGLEAGQQGVEGIPNGHPAGWRSHRSGASLCHWVKRVSGT